MFPVILSEENWSAGKASLHEALPAVGSSHLAEAIAAGLGERTHASFVSKMRAHQGRHAALMIGRDERFMERVAGLDYRNIVPGLFEKAFRNEAMPHPIYTFFKKGDHRCNDEHFHHCNKRMRPMVMVKMARRYAELEWDCVTVDSDEDAYLRDECGSNLVSILFNLFQARAKEAPGKPLFFGSAYTGSIERLLPETARQLAEDYFRLLYSPLLEANVAVHSD